MKISKLVIAITMMVGLSGCQLVVKPYAKDLAKVTAASTKLTRQSDATNQTKQLANIEANYQKYQKEKKTYKEVKTAYLRVIKDAKKHLAAQGAELLKQNTPTDLKRETQATLTQKNAKLTTLAKTVKSQTGIVYSQSVSNTLQSKINEQISSNQAAIVKYILATDDIAKYRAADAKYTKKGHPITPGMGRGDPPRGFFEAIGLTESDFQDILDGIYDYYGHAQNEGWITEKQASAAILEAYHKLNTGKYAMMSTKLHTMNFYQIEQKGDYSSLEGSWRLVGAGANFHNGEGFKWDDAHQLSTTKLSINQYHITNGQITMRKSSGGTCTLSDGSETGQGEFSGIGQPYLGVSGAVGANSWNLDFYPKDAPLDDAPLGTQSNREHIVITTSNSSFTQVYERE